jgi:predicted dienelactone hydrolase
VFAHGYDVTPDIYAAMLDAWVRAGFVVVAPLFPDENQYAVAAQHGANTEDDLRNEPADITFVTRALLLASANQSTGCHVVSGLLQPSELALAGHSDGATVVGLLTYARGNDPQGVSFASLRAGLDFRAVAILSGDEDRAQNYGPPASDTALLVIQSAADQCNPIRNSVKLYDDIHQSNKWFLELLTAHHLPPFDGADPKAFAVVAATSTRFFRVALDGVNPTVSLVVYGNEHPTVAEMFTAGAHPALSSTNLPVSCGRT